MAAASAITDKAVNAIVRIRFFINQFKILDTAKIRKWGKYEERSIRFLANVSLAMTNVNLKRMRKGEGNEGRQWKAS